MLLIPDPDSRLHLLGVISYALQVNLFDQFLEQLNFLSSYANGPGCTEDRQKGLNTRCLLHRDFAPYSFTFVIQRLKQYRVRVDPNGPDDERGGSSTRDFLRATKEQWAAYCADDKNWQHWFNGGLIYQGPAQPADGGFPSLTVSLDSTKHGWFVHT